MRGLAFFAGACLFASPAAALAQPAQAAKKSGTLHNGCEGLGPVKICFTSREEIDGWQIRVGGRKTRVLFDGGADGEPFEMELRQGKYRIKVGAPSRSDMPFFAYDEVVFVRAGRSFLVERYVIASDTECEGSPDIRMVYEFDLQKRTLTSVLNPPWSSDGKVHRFARSVKLPSK